MLYLVATPIGNLEDISYRAVRVLGEVDAVFAEDTRRTLALLRHLGIQKPLYSCHEHNERTRSQQILALLEIGKDVALVSDAGMPGISDPGAIVTQAAIQKGMALTVIPGPSAVITALVLSGLPCERFAFEGFLPRDKKARQKRLDAISKETRTTILYESPVRLRQTLQELLEHLGNRNAAVCRELTKMHEECLRAPLSDLVKQFGTAPRGECVVVLSGRDESETVSVRSQEELVAAMNALIVSGKRAKEAAKILADDFISANQLYALYLQQMKE